MLTNQILFPPLPALCDETVILVHSQRILPGKRDMYTGQWGGFQSNQFVFAEVGASDFPCSQIFAGSRPFSEPETKNVADFLEANKEQFLVYLSFHSYGQYWMTPWGYAGHLPDDYEDLV